MTRFVLISALCLLSFGSTVDAQDVPQEPLMLIDVEELTGEVVTVPSADTVEVIWADTVISVCLAGIDAPELEQPFGADARRGVEKMLLGRQVRVRLRGIDAPQHCERVGQVLLHDEDVSREIVEAGWAWLCRESAFRSSIPVISEAEQEARRRRRGLWKDAEPTSPWMHRGQPSCVDGVDP